MPSIPAKKQFVPLVNILLRYVSIKLLTVFFLSVCFFVFHFSTLSLHLFFSKALNFTLYLENINLILSSSKNIFKRIHLVVLIVTAQVALDVVVVFLDVFFVMNSEPVISILYQLPRFPKLFEVFISGVGKKMYHIKARRIQIWE